MDNNTDTPNQEQFNDGLPNNQSELQTNSNDDQQWGTNVGQNVDEKQINYDQSQGCNQQQCPPPCPPNSPYQQGYYQPSYQQSYSNYYNQQGIYSPAFQKKPESGFAIASLVLGIIGLVLCWIPGINILLSLTALVLGIIAKVKGSGGIAIAGIVIGGIAFVISCIIIALMIFSALILNYSDNFNQNYENYDFFNYNW